MKKQINKSLIYASMAVSIIILLAIEIGLIDYLAKITETRIEHWLYGSAIMLLLLMMAISFDFLISLLRSEESEEKSTKELATHGFSYYDLNP